MNITILHSMIGVAGAVVVGLAGVGNVVGQSAASPAALPPASPAPGVPLPPPTPTTPLPSPMKNVPPDALPRPGGVNPPAPSSARIPGAGSPPVADPSGHSHANDIPSLTPTPGIGAPSPEPSPSYKGEYVTREWKVSPGMLDDGHGGATPVQEFLQKNGVTFGKGASATFNFASSTLVVRNTPEQLKRVEDLISHAGSGVALGAPGSPPRLEGTMGGGLAPTKRPPLGLGIARAPGAANYLPATRPSKPPKASVGIAGGMAAAVDPSYAVSTEFPVTSVEVAKAHLAGELNQDPQASASRYAAIVANFDAQRQAAATAIYGLGEAYRKMGRNAEARVQYARILREFVDFPEVARQSQRQLSTTGVPADADLGGVISAGGRTDNVEEERALLREELELLERELARIQDLIKYNQAPPSSGLQLQRDILRLKQQLARLPREIKEVPRRTANGVPGEESQPKSVEEHSHESHGGEAPPKVEGGPRQ